eukprot:COSAG02_NODE_44955_length_361_cov_1.110687_1_plen_53_part_01
MQQLPPSLPLSLLASGTMPLPVFPLVAGGYVIASGTLLCFPQLLHRQLGGQRM